MSCRGMALLRMAWHGVASRRVSCCAMPWRVVSWHGMSLCVCMRACVPSRLCVACVLVCVCCRRARLVVCLVARCVWLIECIVYGRLLARVEGLAQCPCHCELAWVVVGNQQCRRPRWPPWISSFRRVAWRTRCCLRSRAVSTPSPWSCRWRKDRPLNRLRHQGVFAQRAWQTLQSHRTHD